MAVFSLKQTHFPREWFYRFASCHPIIESSSKEEEHMEKRSLQETATIIFKALTLAMGVALVVLNGLGQLEAETAITMMGIGLSCAGMALLAKAA